MLNLDNILDENIDILNLYTRESPSTTNKNIIPYKEVTSNEDLQKRIQLIEQITKEVIKDNIDKENDKDFQGSFEEISKEKIEVVPSFAPIIEEKIEEIKIEVPKVEFKEVNFNSSNDSKKTITEEETNNIINSIIRKNTNKDSIDSTFIESFLKKEKKKVEESIKNVKPTNFTKPNNNKKKNDIGTSIYNQMKESRKEYFEKYIAEKNNENNSSNIVKPINGAFGANFGQIAKDDSKTPKTLDSYFTSDKNQMSKASIELLEYVFGWIYDNLELFAAVYEDYPIIFEKIETFKTFIPSKDATKINVEKFLYNYRANEQLSKKISLLAMSLGNYNFHIVCDKYKNASDFVRISKSELMKLIATEYNGSKYDISYLKEFKSVVEGDLSGRYIFEELDASKKEETNSPKLPEKKTGIFSKVKKK